MTRPATVDTPEATFIASVDFPVAFLRAKLNTDGTVSVAGAADLSRGSAREACSAGQPVTVVRNQAPEAVYVSSGAIAIGAAVYGAAAGKVGTTNTGEKIGLARTATTAADQRIIVERDSRIP